MSELICPQLKLKQLLCDRQSFIKSRAPLEDNAYVLMRYEGGASVTVPAYLAETSPAERRGRMVTQNELMIVTGQFLAFLINAIIAVVK